MAHMEKPDGPRSSRWKAPVLTCILPARVGGVTSGGGGGAATAEGHGTTMNKVVGASETSVPCTTQGPGVVGAS